MRLHCGFVNITDKFAEKYIAGHYVKVITKRYAIFNDSVAHASATEVEDEMHNMRRGVGRLLEEAMRFLWLERK